MKKTNPCNIFIREMNISRGARNVLSILGVETVDDLHLMHVLDAVPKVGTGVTKYPHVREEFIYTQEINEEVKVILAEYCDIEELDNVGA